LDFHKKAAVLEIEKILDCFGGKSGHQKIKCFAILSKISLSF